MRRGEVKKQAFLFLFVKFTILWPIATCFTWLLLTSLKCTSSLELNGNITSYSDLLMHFDIILPSISSSEAFKSNIGSSSRITTTLESHKYFISLSLKISNFSTKKLVNYISAWRTHLHILSILIYKALISCHLFLFRDFGWQILPLSIALIWHFIIVLTISSISTCGAINVTIDPSNRMVTPRNTCKEISKFIYSRTVSNLYCDFRNIMFVVFCSFGPIWVAELLI